MAIISTVEITTHKNSRRIRTKVFNLIYYRRIEFEKK